MLINQRKLTLQEPRKIRDQTDHVAKSEMTLDRVTKRQYSTVYIDRNDRSFLIYQKMFVIVSVSAQILSDRA